MIGSDALLRTDWDHPVTAPGHRTQPCGNAPCAGWLPQRFLGHILGHHSAPIRTANTWHVLPGCCNPAQRNPRCCELGVARGTLCTGSSPPGCLQQLRRGCGGSAGCTCPHPQLPAAHGSEQSNILRHPPRAQNPTEQAAGAQVLLGSTPRRIPRPQRTQPWAKAAPPGCGRCSPCAHVAQCSGTRRLCPPEAPLRATTPPCSRSPPVPSSRPSPGRAAPAGARRRRRTCARRGARSGGRSAAAAPGPAAARSSRRLRSGGRRRGPAAGGTAA